MDNIYIFETRELDYFNAYLARARQLGYNPVVISDKHLDNDARFAEFKKTYQHLSVNPYDFELNCFARYFALAGALSNNDTFILSDSDIYISDRKIVLNGQSLKDTFVGSEGFFNGRSEWQISPHFSFWNKDLVTDFVNYLVGVYKRNQDDQFLVEHYEVQKDRLGYTAISDMTLLYMWVTGNKIPFINSNRTDTEWNIDHNLSVLNCENDRYRSEHNRKKIEVTPAGAVNFILESGERQPMSCLHFQGGYKSILYDFYSGNYKKFDEFSAKINLVQKTHQLAAGEKHKPFRKLAQVYASIETALDAYRSRIDPLPDELFDVTPPGGGWSYAEVYSHVLQVTLGACMAIEKCAGANCKPTHKKANLANTLVFLFGRFPPIQIK